jgi:TM2 domain-containing membrane protein YozV
LDVSAASIGDVAGRARRWEHELSNVEPPPPPEQPPYPPPAAYGAGAFGQAQQVPTFPDGKPMVDAFGRPASPKSRLAAALLAFFLGALGIHRFYVGKIGTGVLMIVTLGGLGIWVIVDIIVILVGSFRDKQNRVLSNW